MQQLSIPVPAAAPLRRQVSIRRNTRRPGAGTFASPSSPLLVALLLSAERQVAEGTPQPQRDRELGCGDAVFEEPERPGWEAVECQTEAPFQFRGARQGAEFGSEGAVARHRPIELAARQLGTRFERALTRCGGGCLRPGLRPRGLDAQRGRFRELYVGVIRLLVKRRTH